MEQYDAIVIGGGHNGLTAAALLARAGRRVIVLERGERLGGSANSERRPEGAVFSSEAYAGRLLDPAIVRSLDLPRFGYKVRPTEAAYGLMREAPAVTLYADRAATRRALKIHSARDAERFFELRALVARCTRTLPEAGPTPQRRLWPWQKPGPLARDHGAMAALGEAGAYERLRFEAISLGHLLDEMLETPVLKAMLAVRALAGGNQGPYAPGTARRLSLHPALSAGNEDDGLGAYVAGGGAALSDALADALRAFGGEIRTAAPVSAILLENGRAVGAVLEDGAELRAAAVLSSLDIRRTFLTLFAWDKLPKPFLGEVAQRARTVASAKLDFALEALPVFPGLPEGWSARPGDIVITPPLADIERAWRDSVLLKPPAHFPLLVSLPTLLDRSRAPSGRHVVSVLVQHVPATLFDGPWSVERRERFTAGVLVALNEASPGFSDRIHDLRVLLPPDLEAASGGAAQAEAHDSVPTRPLAPQAFGGRSTRFETPITGLFLCGSDAAPDGGLSGASGAKAAAFVLGVLPIARRRS